MLGKHAVDNLAGVRKWIGVEVYATFKRLVFTSPTLANDANVRIQVLRVNNPVRYSSTGSRHATVLL